MPAIHRFFDFLRVFAPSREKSATAARRQCRRIKVWTLTLLCLLPPPALYAGDPSIPRVHTRILTVGPERALKKPSDAAHMAPNGALVMIDAGTYVEDVAVWRQNDLTLSGVGGPVRLMARGHSAGGKAIWVIRGDRVRVENIEFSGARVKDLNGAGIRFEGTDLTLSRCRFHDNQMGLLTVADPHSTIRIEGSEFYRNTVDYRRHGRLGHNIYIGRVKRFVLRDSHVHRAETGHLVKSRAAQNFILYNRITDESGYASYLVDLAEGGEALVMGNLMHKNARAENRSAVSFAAELGRNNPGQRLYVVHNTLVTDYPDALLVNNHSPATALVANNLIQGEAEVLQGPGRDVSNLILPDAGLLDPSRFDYRLTRSSPAVDAGFEALATPEGRPLRPQRQYVDPQRSEPRQTVGKPDVGAYEYTP